MDEPTHIRTGRACLAAALVAATLAFPAHPAVAAAPNDDMARATPIPAAGISSQVDAAGAPADPADPVPSCNSNERSAGSAWFRLSTGRRARPRILRVSARGTTQAAVVAVYAVAPHAGTELVCARATAGAAAARVEHALQPGLDYFVMVGSQGTAGDGVEVAITHAATAWTPVAPLPARRQGVAAADSPDGALLAFGGLQTSFVPGAESGFHSRDVLRRDPRTGVWKVVAQMPSGLSYGRSVRVGRNVYLPGGRSNLVNGAGCLTKAHVVYDTRRRAFATAASHAGPPTYDYAAAADPATGSYFMVGGAWDPTPCDIGNPRDDTQPTGAARAYDTRSGIWTELPPLYTPRRGAAAAVAGGRLFVAGGLQGTQAVGVLEVYLPQQRQWFRGADMPVPVYGAAAGLGWDSSGKPLLYVSGGWTHTAAGRGGVAGETGVTQVYDPATNRWKLLGAAGTPRDALGSAVAGGFLYAVGGFQGQPIRSVERLRLDPVPPRITRVQVARQGRLVLLRVRARDAQSGIASVEWRVPGARRPVRGATVRVAVSPGARVVLVVRDRAGNARTVVRRT